MGCDPNGQTGLLKNYRVPGPAVRRDDEDPRQLAAPFKRLSLGAGPNPGGVLKARGTLPSWVQLLAPAPLHLGFSLAVLDPAAFPTVPGDLHQMGALAPGIQG